jgi:hypothetical protein
MVAALTGASGAPEAGAPTERECRNQPDRPRNLTLGLLELDAIFGLDSIVGLDEVSHRTAVLGAG